MQHEQLLELGQLSGDGADLEVALGTLHRLVGQFLAEHEATMHAVYWRSMPGNRGNLASHSSSSRDCMLHRTNSQPPPC